MINNVFIFYTMQALLFIATSFIFILNLTTAHAPFGQNTV